MRSPSCTVSVDLLELVALRKIAIVNRALASKIDDYAARREMDALVDFLERFVSRIEASEALQ